MDQTGEEAVDGLREEGVQIEVGHVVVLGEGRVGRRVREDVVVCGALRDPRLGVPRLLRGPDELRLLDEPDNYLDVPGKVWLEERLRASSKTVLLVSHARQLRRLRVMTHTLRQAAAKNDAVSSVYRAGGQQARLQILLLELSGATLLLLDEPTDNLDLASAEALQAGLRTFTGTVLAITHDRWFATEFDRYPHFGRDGRTVEVDEPLWDQRIAAR